MESQFRSKSRWPIVARVDRAYRLPTGLVVLVELKTRSALAVRTLDVIQLSVQRVVVEDELRVQVSDEAFVIFPGRRSAPPTSRAVHVMSARVKIVVASSSGHRPLIVAPCRYAEDLRSLCVEGNRVDVRPVACGA